MIFNLIDILIDPILICIAIVSIHAVNILLSDTEQHINPESDSICYVLTFQHLSVNPDKIVFILSPFRESYLVDRYI